MNKLKFKPLKSRLRATFGAAELGARRLGEIDAESEILHDVQITLEGEAKGHGIYLDREFCEAVAAQGNATGDVGLKVRYGHPAMCSDAIGSELGRAKNFKVADFERTIDGQTVKCAGVVADIHILKSAHSAPQGDIAKHVIETAREDPGQFGQSIVFTYADWKVLDADGKPHLYSEFADKKDGYDEWMKHSADGKVYAVLGKLHGTDFTDTPAATDGIFSTGTLAEEAEQMLDEHPEVLAAIEKEPAKVCEFLARLGIMDTVIEKRISGLQAAKDKEINALRAEFAEVAKAKEAELASLKLTLETANTEINNLTAARDEALAALDPLKKEIEQLKADAAKHSSELAEAQAALEKSETRYREQVGLALKPAGDKFAGLTGRERAIAALKAKNL